MKLDITGKSKLSPIPNNKRFIIYTPGKLQQVISTFLQKRLTFSKSLLCSSFNDFKKKWKEDTKAIVITTFYERTDPRIYEKMMKLFSGSSANIIIVNSAIDLNSEDWVIRFYKSIMFFDDLSRPLHSIILTGISHTEYYGHSHDCEEGQCYIQIKLVTPKSKIEPGLIYGYKLNSEDKQSFAILYKTDIEGLYRLEPDVKITKQSEGNLKYIYKIPRTEIFLTSKVYLEVWEF